jgi:hypothetical protein
MHGKRDGGSRLAALGAASLALLFSLTAVAMIEQGPSKTVAQKWLNSLGKAINYRESCADLKEGNAKWICHPQAANYAIAICKKAKPNCLTEELEALGVLLQENVPVVPFDPTKFAAKCVEDSNVKCFSFVVRWMGGSSQLAALSTPSEVERAIGGLTAAGTAEEKLRRVQQALSDVERIAAFERKKAIQDLQVFVGAQGQVLVYDPAGIGKSPSSAGLVTLLANKLNAKKRELASSHG